MSKELIVAGGIVVACLGLTTIAFIKPAAKPTDPEVVTSDSVETPPDRWNTTSTTTTTGTDPFAAFPTNTSGTTTDPFADPFTNTLPIIETPVEPVPTRLDPPPVDTMQERTHVVAKGDTLGDISKQYYGTTKNWKKIQDANKCDPNGLAVGQKLVIPAIESTPVTSTAVSDTSADGLYVVKKGDSYYRIAERELGDPSRSREIEKLNGVAADDLRVGQKLKLPARASSGSPTVTTGGSTSTSTTELPAGAKLHVVGRDEYLVDISEKYYGTTTKWKRIADANPGINPNRLLVGQKIIVPEAGGSSRSSGSDSSSTPVAGDAYVIKAGDTFDKIAKRTLGDASKWKEIAKVNPGVDPTRLMVGQKIVLPKGAQSESPAPAPTPAPRSSTTGSPTTFPAPEPFPAPTTNSSPTTFPAPGSDNPFPGSTSFPEPSPAPVPAPAPADPWDLPPAPAPATGATTQPQEEDPWAAFPGSR